MRIKSADGYLRREGARGAEEVPGQAVGQRGGRDGLPARVDPGSRLALDDGEPQRPLKGLHQGAVPLRVELGQRGADHRAGGEGEAHPELGLKILNGEPVPRGLIIPSVYLDTAASTKATEASRPDDWWASTLPDAWKPK